MSQDRLTKLARGMPCTVRLPGCSGGGEDTVLAHYQSIRLGSGKGYKVPSVIGAYACASCHNVVDSRTFIHDHSRDVVRLAHAEACLETINTLVALGLLRVGAK